MHRLSAKEIHARFERGEQSAVDIVQHYLKRIEIIDKKTTAFLRIFPQRSLEKAAALDAKRTAGKKLGKLAGIPIAVKDNIHVKGELTTCASKILANFRAPFGATVIELLEAEDAILIGKTNMDEFAMGSSTENSAFQQSRNPWDLKSTPGGSSGGSAVAVSARLSSLSLGSDTGGSIRQPAAFCGVVGFKPTYGRVSRYGLVAFGSSLDQIGPFGINTEDVALVMEVIGRHCSKDSTSIPKGPDEYRLPKKLPGLVIGIPWNFLEKLEKEPKALFQNSLRELEKLGAKLVEVDLRLLTSSVAVYYIIATAEASTNLARFDGIRYGLRAPSAKTLDEVYELSKEEGFGREVKRRILLGTFVLSSGYQDAYYKKAQKVRTLIIRQFAKAFETCQIIAMPTTPSEAFETGAIQDPLQMYLQDIYTIPSNLAGLPTISIPCGFTETGKPFGMQLIGPQQADVHVLQVAHAFEGATDYHLKMPKIATEEG